MNKVFTGNIFLCEFENEEVIDSISLELKSSTFEDAIVELGGITITIEKKFGDDYLVRSFIKEN